MTQDEQTTCPICAAPLLPDDICATDIEMGICHAACLDGSPVVDLETGAPTAGPIDTYRYGDLEGATVPAEDPKITAARAAFKLFRKAARKDRKWPTTARTAFYAGHIAALNAVEKNPSPTDHVAMVDWENPDHPAVKLFVGFDVEGYVEDYELRGDDGDYSPNAKEKMLMVDAIYGVVSNLHEELRKIIPSKVSPATGSGGSDHG